MVTFPEHGGGIGSSRLLALAAGAPAGFCSDTGGSCRNPANLNGVVGFRPTGGCYNGGDGVVPLSTTRDTVGTEPPHSTYLLTLDELQWRKRHAPGSETGMMECLTCRTDRSHCDGCNLVRQDLQRLPQGDPTVNLKGLRFGYPTIWWTDLQADVSTSHLTGIAKVTWSGCCKRAFGMQALQGLSSANLQGTNFAPCMIDLEARLWCRPSLFMTRQWST